MTIYVVGDIQGCFECLDALLEKVAFSPGRDQLWAVGDLVNRGPGSLETLRFCKRLDAGFRTVLGNHDLHLLAVARGARAPGHRDTLQGILSAHDKIDLLDWLQHQPLMLRHGDYTIVHAGLPPQWSVEEAGARAREVEASLASPSAASRLLHHMYGNSPDRWQDDLEGYDRARMIINYFTRMRYCTADGQLELTNKEPPGTPGAPPG